MQRINPTSKPVFEAIHSTTMETDGAEVMVPLPEPSGIFRLISSQWVCTFASLPFNFIFPSADITEEDIKKVVAAPKFATFVRRLEVLHKANAIVLQGPVFIKSIKMFGSNNVGFVIGEVIGLQPNTRSNNMSSLAGFFAVRGNAVSIMIVLNQCMLLVVQQLRVPVGKRIIETVAGMMDADKDPVGVAIKEVKEEAGIEIKRDQLTFCLNYYTSPGLLDEEIACYVHETEVADSTFQQICSRPITDEVISLRTIPLYDTNSIYASKDAKLIMTYEFYMRYIRKVK